MVRIHRETDRQSSDRLEVGLACTSGNDLAVLARSESPQASVVTNTCAIDGPICRCARTMKLVSTCRCDGGQVYRYECENCRHELRITAWD